MTITVTLNPCIDQTLTIASFTHGGMNRVIHKRQDIAGKGINVSVALKNLGEDSLCVGINYRENGYLMENFLNERQVPHDFITVDGAIRSNIKLYEQDTGIMTEINQPGHFVSIAAVEPLLQKIKAASHKDILVLSGSRPQGVATDIYQRMIDESAATVVLDTEGEALRKGLMAKRKAFLIKPNLFELENAFGIKLTDKNQIAEFCMRLIEEGMPDGVREDSAHEGKGGTQWICVSLGNQGAMLVGKGAAYFSPALDIPVKGVQGAGDSMVAGMVHKLSRGFDDAGEWLRYAVAAASASVMLEGTQMGTREGFTQMLERVTVERL